TSVPLEISLRNTAIEGSCATPRQRTGRLANLADLHARGYNEGVFPSHAMGGRRQWRLLDVPPVLWLLASLAVALLLASATQELAVDAPFTRGVIESMIGFTALFAALVLFLFPEDASGGRLWWIAGALIIIGLTAFGFGILEPSPRPSASVLAYAWLASRTAAAFLICVALVPRKPQAAERRGVVAISLALVTVCLLVRC